MRKLCLLLPFLLSPWVGAAQLPESLATPDAAKGKSGSPTKSLVHVKTVVAPGELATALDTPIMCDHDGSLYLQSENLGVSGIRKLSANGEKIGLFRPSTSPDLKDRRVDSVGYFALGKGNQLYELVYPHESTRYVVAYKADGTYQATTKLQPGFPWIPSALSVFPSGNLLITGQEYDREHMTSVKFPFTGIFSPEGKLVKELELEDDPRLYQMALNGDSRVSAPGHASANLSVEFSQMETGPDGNVYLMRWITPAIFYVISGAGDVVRRFTVDPGDEDYRPASMHISGNRIAVLFYQPQTMDEIMKVVDLEGRELNTLPLDESPQFGVLGTAFACYTADGPSQFTFLAVGKDDKLELRIAEPR